MLEPQNDSDLLVQRQTRGQFTTSEIGKNERKKTNEQTYNGFSLG